MLALISSTPVETHYLEDFRRLAEIGKVSSSSKTPGHKDGWGVVHLDKYPDYLGHMASEDDGEVEANAATSIGYEKVYANIEKVQLNGIFLAHLRRGSSGKKIRENTPPFIENNWAFSHNGNINGLGSNQFSDSKIFFKMLMEEIVETDDIVKSIQTVVNKIRHNNKYDSLTFILSDNKTFYAYRDYTQDGDYYTIKYATTNDSILIFSQEEIWDLNWNTIPNKSLIIVKQDQKILDPIKI